MNDISITYEIIIHYKNLKVCLNSAGFVYWLNNNVDLCINMRQETFDKYCRKIYYLIIFCKINISGEEGEFMTYQKPESAVETNWGRC